MGDFGENHGGDLDNSTHTRVEEEGNDFLPVVILFIFGSCCLGAIARMIVHKISLLPYTVILLIFGLILGAISSNVPAVKRYTTSMTNMDPRIIFYVFLPVLVFESAYAMEAHTFLKTFWQIVILAVFGICFSVITTAYVCLTLFGQYGWNWPISLMFGSIISATDPVAVVALLKELGASKQLAILLEGESLLNDGTAIVVFDVMEKFVVGENLSIGDIIQLFLLKAIAGPIFGYAMGQIAVLWLVNIFNDALTEITVTLAFTYITFFVGEGLFHSSGVLATVVLGVTLSSNRASVSPEVEVFLHRFWEVLAYLANTLIFILVGTVITEQVIKDTEVTEIMLNIALYCVLTLVRAAMVIIFSPITTRLGYGMSAKNGSVLTWGGLRGAVGLALALIVKQNPHIDETGETQSEILVQTAGIVLLTLVLNATTIKPLLWVLGMSEISVPKRIAMASAVRSLRDVVTSTQGLYKTDRFLADADWDVVAKYTHINDPYQTLEEEAAMAHLTSFERTSVCPDCHAIVQNEPSQKEYNEMLEEARLRLLKAEKISYWRQFEHGILAREALQKLVELVDTANDSPPNLTNTKEIEKTWKIRSIYSVIKEKLTKWQHSKEQKSQIAAPKSKCANQIYRLCISTAFEIFIYMIIFANTATIIWQIIEEVEADCIMEEGKSGIKEDSQYNNLFRGLNIMFAVLYTIEAILKFIAFRWGYFSSNWNIFDFVVLLATYVDIFLDEFEVLGDPSCDSNSLNSAFNPQFLRSGRALRFVRLIRTMRLAKGVLPKIIDYLDEQVNKKLRFAYDVGKGYVMAEEEVLHYLDHLIDNRKIATHFRTELAARRLEVIKGLGLLQKLHPGVAVSIKTQQATRRILNNVRDKVHEMCYEGILDESEAEKLEINIEFQMKQLIKIPPSIRPPPPEKIIGNLNWVRGDEILIEYITHNAVLVTMSDGEQLNAESDSRGGLYVIISGLVKIEKYEPTAEQPQPVKVESTHALKKKPGPAKPDDPQKIPNESKTSDYLTTGSVLGEIALLTGKPGNIVVSCETSVQMYHISYDAIQSAIDLFTDEPSLEYRLWRVCALRVASRLLHQQSRYLQWSKEKMKIFLEKSKVLIKKHALPEGGKVYEFPTFHIDSNIVIDVVLIHGVAEDPFTQMMLEGPVYVPQKITQLTLIPGKTDKHVLLVTMRETDMLLHPENGGQGGSGSTLNQTSSLCLRHASKQRNELQKKISAHKSAQDSSHSLKKRHGKKKDSLESVEYADKDMRSMEINSKIPPINVNKGNAQSKQGNLQNNNVHKTSIGYSKAPLSVLQTGDLSMHSSHSNSLYMDTPNTSMIQIESEESLKIDKSL